MQAPATGQQLEMQSKQVSTSGENRIWNPVSSHRPMKFGACFTDVAKSSTVFQDTESYYTLDYGRAEVLLRTNGIYFNLC